MSLMMEALVGGDTALRKWDRVFGEAMRFYSPISGKTLDKSSDKSGKQGRAID
jgi:hypothetical protein